MSEVLTCQWCGTEFERPHERGPAPMFCRPAHRQRSHEHHKDRELKHLRKQNRKLQERLNRIDNVMIGNTRIWELDRIAMEMEVEADVMVNEKDDFNPNSPHTANEHRMLDEMADRFRKDALFIRRLEWDLGQLHTAVRGDTNRRGGRYDRENWKGPRP